MDEVMSLQTRAGLGATRVFLQVVVVKVAALIASIILARILSPRDFGLYAIAAFAVAGFAFLGDIGLGAALIQQRAEPTQRHFASVFTIQLGLSLLATTIGMLAGSVIVNWYHLDQATAWLIRALLISLVLLSLRTTPAVILERRLSYGALSVVEMAEGVTFSAVAVIGALSRLGVWSFAAATLARSVVGVVFLYFLTGWRPQLVLDMNIVRRLTRFGFTFQVQNALSFAKDAMTPTVVALLLGPIAVGYVNFAYTVATIPLPLAGVFGRVTFPVYSRAQSDPTLLATMVERSIRLSAILVLPLAALLIASAPEVVRYIYSDKWGPAVPSLYLFVGAIVTGSTIGATLFSLFYATGRGRWPLYFTVLYGVLDWCIGVPLVLIFGFTGIALRAVLVSWITLPLLLVAANKIVRIRIWPQLQGSLVAGCFAGAVDFGLLRLLPTGRANLVIATLVAALGYAVVIAWLERPIITLTLLRLGPRGLTKPLKWYLAR